MKYVVVLALILVLFFCTPVLATTLTFEGLPNATQIGTYSGVTFGIYWYSLIDSDAGGGGNFANEPSPSTVADCGGNTPQSNTRITFPYVISSGSFYYSLDTNVSSVTVHFFDSGDTEIGTSVLNVCGISSCTVCSGDPTGLYCSWTQASIMPGTAYMEFTGTALAGDFLIDNLTFDPASVPTMNEWGMIVFIVIAGVGAVYYLRKQRRKEL